MMENHWLMIPGVFAPVLQESALLLQWDHNRANRVRDFLISSGRFVSRRGPRRLDPRRGGRNTKKASNRASVCCAHDSLEENLPLSERDPAGCGARKQSQWCGRLFSHGARPTHRRVFASFAQRSVPSGSPGFDTHWFTDEQPR